MHREPAMEQLDDPVQEYIPLIRTSQTFTITNLPRGKYIVCGEALGKMGDVFQQSSLETRIRKRESKGKKTRMDIIFLYTFSFRSAEREAGTDSDLHGDGGVGDSLRHIVPGL